MSRRYAGTRSLQARAAQDGAARPRSLPKCGCMGIAMPAMSHPVSRRTVLRALAVALAASPTLARSQPFMNQLGANVRPPAAPAGATFSQSVCRWCYPKISLEDLATSAQSIGLASIELLDPPDWPTVQKHGLTCAMANGTMTIKRGLNRLENHISIVPSMQRRIEECGAAGIPNVICFSGNRDGLDDAKGLENCATGIRQLVGAAEMHGVTLCMELLNSKVDHHDYMCDHTAWGVELVHRVGSPRFRLLYDIYHMQIMEGDVVRTIQTHHAEIAHYHTGGNPGRHELDETQELYYPAIMRAIHATGFRGYVAQEFIPTRDPIASLREAVALCRT